MFAAMQRPRAHNAVAYAVRCELEAVGGGADAPRVFAFAFACAFVLRELPACARSYAAKNNGKRATIPGNKARTALILSALVLASAARIDEFDCDSVPGFAFAVELDPRRKLTVSARAAPTEPKASCGGGGGGAAGSLAPTSA